MDLLELTVTAEGLTRVSHGQPIRPSDVSGARLAANADWVRLLDPDGALVALGTPLAAAGFLHPEVVLI